MRRSRLLSGLFIAGVLAFSGCGNSGNVQQPLSFGTSRQQLAFTSVQQGEVSPSGTNPAGVSVIRTAADWESFWHLLYVNYAPGPALPAVDFSRSVIVAVVDTPRPTGGYSITITRILPTSSGVMVSASQVSPGESCIVTQALTQPFHVVTTPIFSGAATLELVPSVFNCGQR